MANGKPKKSKKKLFIFGGIGLLLVILIIVVVAGGNKENIISVNTEKVETRTITQVVSATGKINPVDQVELSPEVTGEIVDLPVEEGDIVKKGELLIRIKPDQYIAQRNQAKASLEAAQAQLKIREATLNQVKAEYERVKGLFEKGLASQSEIDIAKSNFLQSEGAYESQKASVAHAEESYKETEVQLDKTQLNSPMDGTISALYVEMSERVLGSSFSQGTRLMTVANLNEMEATVEVDENDVVLISLGDTARVEIDAFGDKVFRGVVSQIGNSAISTGTGTQNEVVNFEVKILLLDTDAQIRPGMSCDADIETETKVNVKSVPIQCVTARADMKEMQDDAPKEVEAKNTKPKEVVFIAVDNVAKMIEVETGISDDTYIEIKKGLEGEEMVITGPYRAISKELHEDAKLMIQEKGNKKPENSEKQ